MDIKNGCYSFQPRLQFQIFKQGKEVTSGTKHLASDLWGYSLMTSLKGDKVQMCCIRRSEVKVFAYLHFWSQVGHPLTLALPLSCPQISTAYIMTSSVSVLAGGLSLKKAESYYCNKE